MKRSLRAWEEFILAELRAGGDLEVDTEHQYANLTPHRCRGVLGVRWAHVAPLINQGLITVRGTAATITAAGQQELDDVCMAP